MSMYKQYPIILARRAHLSLSLMLCACSNIHLSEYRRVQFSVDILRRRTPPIIGHSRTSQTRFKRLKTLEFHYFDFLTQRAVLF